MYSVRYVNHLRYINEKGLCALNDHLQEQKLNCVKLKSTAATCKLTICQYCTETRLERCDPDQRALQICYGHSLEPDIQMLQLF